MNAPHSKRVAVWTFGLVCAVAASSSATLGSIDEGQVQFLAQGPMGLKINGSGTDLRATEKNDALVFSARLTEFKTGIGLRDQHLRKYLETSKYPEARLSVAKNKLQFAKDNATVTSRAVGELTLHGVSRTVEFEYRAKRTGSDFHVQGMTEIDIRDYKIEVPCYLGVCVEPTVKIKVKIKLRDS